MYNPRNEKNDEIRALRHVLNQALDILSDVNECYNSRMEWDDEFKEKLLDTVSEFLDAKSDLRYNG